MKILVASPQPDRFAPLEHTLHREGIGPFIKADTASHALELLCSPPEQGLFELILLDAALCPDNFRIIKNIKNTPCSRNIPVLLLLSPHDLERGRRGMQAGADDFCVLEETFGELALRISLLQQKVLAQQESTENRLLQTALEKIPFLFLRISATGRIMEANRAFRQMTGLSHEELRETFFLQRFCFQDPEGVKKLMGTAFTGNTPIFDQEFVAEFTPELPRCYFADLIPTPRQEGGAQSLLLFARDITRSKNSCRASQVNEAAYRNLFNRLPVAIVEQDFSQALQWLEALREEGIVDLRSWLRQNPAALQQALQGMQVINANRKSFALFGVTSHAQLSLHADQILYSLDPDIGLEQIMALLENSWRIEFESRVQPLNNKPVHCIARIFRLQDGKSGHIILVLLDFSRLKRTEEVLRSSEARYRAIVEDQTELICRFLPNGKLTFVNSAFARYYDRTPEQLIGMLFPTSLPENDVPLIINNIRMLTPEHPVTTFENRTEHPKSKLLWQQWTLRAVYDSRSNLTEYQAVGQDVTWRKHIEHELKAAKESAEQASHIKSTFLATVSHEIRTPLTAILGFSELLKHKTDLPDDLLFPIRRISQAGNRLLALINDVLDLSKIEAGKLEIEENDFSLSHMITDLVEMFIHQCQDKNVELQCDLDPQLPSWVWAPEKRLHQVLSNLLSNAVKFTERGEVRLKAEQRTKQIVAFSVSDTGIGIAPDKLDTIFDPFTQAGSFVTRKYGGTGLGLSISKRLVAMMGGELDVESKPGQGTSFQFVIPVFPARAPQPLRHDDGELPRRFHNLKILLVDDDRSIIEVARAFLQERGHHVEMAEDGAQAVEMRIRNRYDLILMDVQMSPMDGLEATRRIRDWEHKNNALYTPIIALTAHAMKGDKQRLLKAGMDGYGAKPFNFKQLVNVVTEVLSRPRDANGCLLPEASCPLPQIAQAGMLQRNIQREILETPYLDMHQALKNISRKFWQIGALVFVEDTPPQLEQLREHAQASELAQVKALAHKLKGASGNVGAARMHLLCQVMEQAADQEDTPRVDQLLGLLLESWAQTLAGLQSELEG